MYRKHQCAVLSCDTWKCFIIACVESSGIFDANSNDQQFKIRVSIKTDEQESALSSHALNTLAYLRPTQIPNNSKLESQSRLMRRNVK